MESGREDDFSRVFRILNDMHKDLADIRSRLDVHQQAHVQIDADMRRMGEAIQQTNQVIYGTAEKPGLMMRLISVENRSQDITDALKEIKSQNSKIIWAIVTPFLTAIVGGILWALGQALP